ncbi:MAG: 50S ribosomal protein L37ae [Candidatus Thorarchaeota archaeon]
MHLSRKGFSELPTKKVGTAGRFGARYGSKLRSRVLEVELKAKGHRCPACNTRALRRKAAGLWFCRKCGALFTGGAYVPFTESGRTALRAIEQNLKGDLITLREREEASTQQPPSSE